MQRQCHAKDNVMLKTPKQNTFAKDRCACELQLAAVGATALRAGSPQGSPTLPSRGHIVPRLKGQTSGGLLLDLPGGLCQLEFACAPSANCMLHREASEQVLKTSTCAVDPLSCLHVSPVSRLALYSAISRGINDISVILLHPDSCWRRWKLERGHCLQFPILRSLLRRA